MNVKLHPMGTTASRALPSLNARMSLAVRAGIATLVLGIEKSLLNLLVDFSATQTAQGFGAIVRVAQHWGFRFAVTFAGALALFCYVREDDRLRALNAAARGESLSIPWLLAHFACIALLVPVSYFLYGDRGAPLPFPVLVALWLLLAAMASIALLNALAPWALWRRLSRTIGVLWLYAGAAGLAAASAMEWSQRLWSPTAAVTFRLVRIVLLPFIPSLRSNAPAHILFTNHFAIEVADVCSGLEGMGLMLAFCCAWLIYFRKEYRFPHALILIPAGLVLMFALNVVRISTLMAIGNAGFPNVAVYGFHSQAGWIAFNLAAGGVAYATLRSRWLSRNPGVQRESIAGENPTAAYLLPFLSILAAAMLARAISSGFETLYVLRLVAAATCLAIYWPRLKSLDWRFSWRAPVLGGVVFGVWIACASFVLHRSVMPHALVAMAPIPRALWIIARVGASVVTVPIAEELAYRGYLMRRLVAADFERVRFESVGVWPLIVSSAVFAISEGSLWLPGAIAALLFGAILIRTARFGEAVAAHATTNGLVCAYVLLANQWQLW